MSNTVSVIIPSHNYARFIRRAIGSALAQTHRPTEVIVIDDGSTDDTPRVLAEFGDRIKVILQPRQGPAVARNAGIRASTGRYVALLDSDDYWHPEKLARQVAVLQADPALGVVGCARTLVDPDDRLIRVVPVRPPVHYADARARVRALARRKLWVEGSCSGALIPRAVLDAVGLFDERLTAAEDWDLWLRIAGRYAFVNLPDVLTSIRIHGAGFARDADKVERNQWKVFDNARAAFPDAFDRVLCRQVRALILADAGGEHAGHQDCPRALVRYAASLRAWPFSLWRWGVVAKLALKTLLQRRRASHAAPLVKGRAS